MPDHVGHGAVEDVPTSPAGCGQARAPSWRFRAVGAAFDLKDRLRARGYRWDATAKNWWREVPDSRRSEEEWWLAGHVYSVDANPKALGPLIERVTWHERYAPSAGRG